MIDPCKFVPTTAELSRENERAKRETKGVTKGKRGQYDNYKKGSKRGPGRFDVGGKVREVLKEGMALVAEDKSPKETWVIPKARFVAVCLWGAVLAGWSICQGLTPPQVEYAVRGFWADHLPMRMRRFIGVGIRWKGSFIPYFYSTVQLTCFGGEEGEIIGATVGGRG